MGDLPFPSPDPIEGVLFDFHSTLVDQGDPRDWIRLAWKHAGRDGDPVDVLGAAKVERLASWVDRIWERARDVDPNSERDLDPIRHRKVFRALVDAQPEADPELGSALYETLLEPWTPYDEAGPVLRALKEQGVRTALISNVGVDVRRVLDRAGFAGLFDAVVLSYEVGAVKPDAEIFQRALDLIGVPASRALMVGDSWRDDAGAAELGIRTLVLPRTAGSTHGLDLVLRLTG